MLMVLEGMYAPEVGDTSMKATFYAMSPQVLVTQYITNSKWLIAKAVEFFNATKSLEIYADQG